jgi:Carboxypeptidase regulatory-like domain
LNVAGAAHLSLYGCRAPRLNGWFGACSLSSTIREASQLLLLFAAILGVPANPFMTAQAAPALYISGTITSGDIKLPGVIITAKNIATGDSISAATDEQGYCRSAVPTPGTYRVRTELFGFSPANLLIEVADHEIQADFTLSLAAAGSTAANNQLPVRHIAKKSIFLVVLAVAVAAELRLTRNTTEE